jgi:hypothetical protein
VDDRHVGQLVEALVVGQQQHDVRARGSSGASRGVEGRVSGDAVGARRGEHQHGESDDRPRGTPQEKRPECCASLIQCMAVQNGVGMYRKGSSGST